MCQDQGLAIIPWAALGGGAFLSKEQRKRVEEDPKARKSRRGDADGKNLKMSELLEQLATKHGSTLQSVVSRYSTHLLSLSRELTAN